MEIINKILSAADINYNVNIIEHGAPYWLVIVHGLGEHSQRHEHLYGLFASDFNIISFDLRGHGKSSGKRACVDSFNDFIQDLSFIINFLIKEYRMEKYILFGHSMGGLVVRSYISSDLMSLKPKAVFFSSPAFGTVGALGRFVSKTPKSILNKIIGLQDGLYLKGVLDLKKLSHDPTVYENYIKDELNSLKINIKLLLSIIKQINIIANKDIDSSISLFGAIGSKDALVCPDSVKSFFVKNKIEEQLCFIEGAYHELHNEIQKYKTPYIEFLKKSIRGIIYENI
ncbi:MAG: lysophospholipase [Bacteriovoracaceae bacterium]|jgi:alpha-beta hydrolase superfamily lysophospholipase|nr:lysophospholipase [Bacteriovoracaceae bacterium]